YVTNNHPEHSLFAHVEKKDGSQEFDIEVLPGQSFDQGVPTVWGMDIDFDPEEGTPTAVFGNYTVQYWTGEPSGA
ncbi:MAG: hypothetical protein R3330_16340, partial [Saprospiraceae bacterium]|nr:hypothetical protein [Saprospiraceae bacterium]